MISIQGNLELTKQELHFRQDPVFHISNKQVTGNF